MDQALARRKLLRALHHLFGCTPAFEEYDWQLQPVQLFLSMHPRDKPEEAFLLRITFDSFPDTAPSYLFVNPQTKKVDPDSWPTGRAFKKDWPGICLKGTREFYAVGHPERRGEWSLETDTVASVLQEIQVELNKCQ